MTPALPDGRRAVVERFGETPLDAVDHHLSVVAQPAPDPADLAADDVIIAVESAAVGWVDLLMTSGQYQHMPAPPYTPGLEYSGRVAWVGAAARDQLSVGDAVIADGLLTGPRSKGAHQRYGGFATWAVAPASGVLPLPDGFTFDQGSCFLGSYETAYHCLVTCGQLQPGETVLIHGASGATGLAAVHLAKLLGATVIATGRSREKLDVVRAEGADHVLCTAAEPVGVGLAGLRGAVRAVTNDQGVDVVYDGVGGEITAASMRCVRFGARVLIVGWASTPFVARGRGQRGAPNANQIPTNLIMMKGLKIIGCPTVIATHRDPSIRAARLASLLAWAREGRLRPRVGPAYALDDVVAAMRAKWDSRFVGGCVLHPRE